MTGCNDAFIIDTAKKDELITADPKSAEIIRPILRGKDIKRYAYSFAGKWIINVHNGIKDTGLARINIDDYPAVKAHLDNYYDRLEKREDKDDAPYNLRNCAYMDDFSKQKIVWGELSDNPKFVLDTNGKFTTLNTTFLMTGEHLGYLLAFLNSPISKYYFSSNLGTTSGVGTTRWLKYTIETLPVPYPEKDILDRIEKLSLDMNNESLSKEKDTEILSNIYLLYGFSDEEIAFIERNS